MTNKNSSNFNQSEQAFVSVIMNCYNGEKYLREAIDSVLNQTYKNWEIIFWDNQSTDKSAEICKSYKEKRIRYFYAPSHTKLGQGRNLAIEQAKGDWIGFLDCDDLWFPMKIEKQVVAINNCGPELGLVYSDAAYLIEKEGATTVWGGKVSKLGRNVKSRYLPSGNIFSAMLKENLIPLVTALVRRSAFIDVGGVSADFKQAEDYELFVKITRCYEAIAIQETTCLYRIHSSNLSHYQFEESYTEVLTVIRRYLPQQDAVIGAGIWQSNYAGYLFINGRHKEGIAELISSKNYWFFLKRIFSRFVQYYT